MDIKIAAFIPETYIHHASLKAFSDWPNPSGILPLNSLIWIIPFSNGNTSVGYVGSPEFFQRYPIGNSDRMRALIRDSRYLRDRFIDQEMVIEPRTIEGYAITSTKFFDIVASTIIGALPVDRSMV